MYSDYNTLRERSLSLNRYDPKRFDKIVLGVDPCSEKQMMEAIVLDHTMMLKQKHPSNTLANFKATVERLAKEYNLTVKLLIDEKDVQSISSTHND